jgi:hypothetical protein
LSESDQVGINWNIDAEVLVICYGIVSRVAAPLREEWPAPSGGFKPRLRQTGAIYPKEPWNFKRDYMGPMSQAPR